MENSKPHVFDMPKELSDNVIKTVNACIDNAKDFFESAKLVSAAQKYQNIAYHLLVLALEEIGKSNLTLMSFMSGVKINLLDYEYSEKPLEDHVKKIFWALWSPFIEGGRLKIEDMNRFKGMAKDIHENRLKAIYVTAGKIGDSIPLPKDSISNEVYLSLYKITESLLELSGKREFSQLSTEKKQVISWFITNSNDPQKRGLMFDKTALDKMEELKDFEVWIQWLMKRIEEIENTNQKLFQTEMGRITAGESLTAEKWKIKVRLFTNSHSVKDKELAWWNKNIQGIKIRAVGKKNRNELLLEVIVPPAIHITQLWGAGSSMVNRFIVALNIGSFGFFWFQIPKQTESVFEEVVDLEKKASIVLGPPKKMEINWGRGILGDQEIRNIGLCFGLLPLGETKEEIEPFTHYLSGLSFLSKTDIHLSFTPNAFMSFFNSIKTGMKHYGLIKEDSEFEKVFVEYFCSIGMDQSLIKRYFELGIGLPMNKVKLEEVTLSEAGALKIMSDRFFMDMITKRAEELGRMEKNKNQTTTVQ